MSGLLEGKVAVVTGGASGNGRNISYTFAQHGADVIIADLQEEPREGGEAVTTTIQSELSRRAKFVSCDVRKPDDLRNAVDAAEDYGGLTTMVNNAGIFRSEDFRNVTSESYDRIMDINAKGVFFGCQAAADKMMQHESGSIINISSVAGLLGAGPFAVYSMSKGAIRLLTYSLAEALGPHGVRVNAIHPGIIETTMTTSDVAIVGTEDGESFLQKTPQNRNGRPEDVANTAVYLASELASYVNGTSQVVDGGLTTSL